MFSSRILKTCVLALALSGAATLASLPAQAGESTGTWRNGMVSGPYGVGWYGPGGVTYEHARTVRRRAYVPPRHRYNRSYRSHRYAPNRYYRDRYYGNRYYGNRYYGNRYYQRRGYGWYGERPRPGRVDRALEQGSR
ncbi:hypothetical protein [Microvirga mediterraneensis]|uniref:Uncharacterized protein n=1 Tax=Microvirga mediterraneensis TaxID=2754695 RepID=A0A838BJ44_9HYPH|nr:hypothetical protein [Microvirga mediterraneensis]MBA1155510.1 hypothetical protein [Microvirga mediterraneensis]